MKDIIFFTETLILKYVDKKYLKNVKIKKILYEKGE
jgi:hypothetical protein